jgi:hypothetical protein
LVIVTFVGLAASIPFVAVQRYNQLRIRRILARRA